MSTVEHRILGDMQKKDIVGKYQTTTITHNDGNTRQIYYTDIETPFPEGKKIVSITDPEGYISNANSVFVAMSGYSRDELMGMPHYILRHPDMPVAAFKDLWQKVKMTGRWQGCVKNLRKDGGFYWVFASVFALKRNGELVGYTSSRIAAPMDKRRTAEQLYQEMLQSR